MAACNFSIPFAGSTQDVLMKAKSSVLNQGGNFNGDDDSGSFDVSVFGNTIKGSYLVSGQNLDITIDSKPFLIPCSTIEGFLRNQIGV
jgi:hypothetical protein